MLAQLMPDQRRVRVEPARQLGDEAIAIAADRPSARRAAERQPVLMAIQLPDDLVIAARRVEVRAPRDQKRPRRAAVVHRIEVPVDCRRSESSRRDRT